MKKKFTDLSDIAQKVIKLWDEGYSATEIGNNLGMTRNSVMGHVHRARCAGIKINRAKEIRSGSVEKPPRKVRNRSIIMKAKKESKPLPPLPPLPPMKAKPLTLMQLTPNSCRYIINDDPKKVLFCGSPKKVRSYCKVHADLCYIPSWRKKCLTELLAQVGTTHMAG